MTFRSQTPQAFASSLPNSRVRYQKIGVYINHFMVEVWLSNFFEHLQYLLRPS
jgi:hypothetical protein